MEMQLDRFVSPAQQFAALMVEGLERSVRCQFGLARSYTHFTMERWREALEVQDPRGLGHFLDQHGQALQELGRQMAEEVGKFMHLGQDVVDVADHLAQRGLQTATEAVQAAAEVEPASARGTRRA
jgi:phasin family protein